jgi:hypothetical protein
VSYCVSTSVESKTNYLANRFSKPATEEQAACEPPPGTEKDPESTDTTAVTESRLWMKTVIDIIHDDIQSRARTRDNTSDDAPTTVSACSSIQGRSFRQDSNQSARGEKKRDSQETNRIQNFLVDTSYTALEAAPEEECSSPEDARRRIAAQLEEFDVFFEDGGEKKPS